MITVSLFSILIDFSLREWTSLVPAFIFRPLFHTHTDCLAVLTVMRLITFVLIAQILGYSEVRIKIYFSLYCSPKHVTL